MEMKNKLIAALGAIVLLASVITAYVCTSPVQYTQPHVENDTLFQVSVLAALNAGDYTGALTFDEMRAHGDFGLGTFDALDGEMIELNGTFYQVKSDGHVYAVNGSARTPWAQTTYFEPDENVTLSAGANGTNYSQLQQILDAREPTPNFFYAVKITGEFAYVKARAPPRQVPPYPTLTDALKNQSVFEFYNVTGTLVGFYSPLYMNGTVPAGWHFHFLNANATSGGHVLDLTLSHAMAAIDETTQFSMALPDADAFASLNLTSAA
ncbi:MAG: acetolactate decarboxylase [Halobacteriota archaeon]